MTSLVVSTRLVVSIVAQKKHRERSYFLRSASLTKLDDCFLSCFWLQVPVCQFWFEDSKVLCLSAGVCMFPWRFFLVFLHYSHLVCGRVWLLALWQRWLIIHHQRGWHESAACDTFLSAIRHQLDSYIFGGIIWQDCLGWLRLWRFFHRNEIVCLTKKQVDFSTALHNLSISPCFFASF